MNWKRLKNWWKNNQEKNSDEYLEREDFKKELNEFSKDIRTIFESSFFDFQEKDLNKAILVQNLHIQKKLTQATDSLKNATWILALATIVLAWVVIIDSRNSNYIIQTLQGIVTIIVYFIIFGIAITLIWKIIVFVFKWIKRVLNDKK